MCCSRSSCRGCRNMRMPKPATRIIDMMDSWKKLSRASAKTRAMARNRVWYNTKLFHQKYGALWHSNVV